MVDAAAPQLPIQVTPVPEKSAEDHNLDTYERVFLKCMGTAARIIKHRHGDEPTEDSKDRQLEIAKAIFSQFYTDQGMIKQASMQAKAMFQGLTKMLEGRS